MEIHGQFHTTVTLSRWKAIRYLLDRSVGEPRSRCGHHEEVENSWLCQESNFIQPEVEPLY
jgi:hypothetical protein